MSSDEVIGKFRDKFGEMPLFGEIVLQSYCITAFGDSQNVKTDSQKKN